MSSSAPTAVGGVNGTITLDRFRVELWDAVPGIHTSPTKVSIPANKAQFIVSASFNSASYGVIGVNKTPIEIRRIRDHWTSSIFTIVRHDVDDQPWELVVMPSRWR